MTRQAKMENITENIKKIATSLKKTEVTVVFVNPEDDYQIGSLEAGLGSFLNNLLIVGETELEITKTRKKLTYQDWYNNLKLFKNAVLIYHHSPSDINNMMEILKKYYTLVFSLNTDNDLEYNGWLKKDDVYINKNIKKFNSLNVENFSSINNIQISSIRSEDSYADSEREGVEIDINIEENKVKPVSTMMPSEIDYTIFNNLPRPTMDNDPKSKTWLQEFYSYLRDLITRILPPGKEKLIPYILNSKTIKEVWVKAFTHKLENNNIEENYEVYEAIGDQVMSYSFYVYYNERDPTADQGRLTNLKGSILKAEPQAELGKKMNLHLWCIASRAEIRDNLKTAEDLTEAFFGALDIILNKKSLSIGQGANICCYLYKLLFKNYNFATEKKLNAPTWLIQLFEQIATYSYKKEKTFYAAQPKNLAIEDWQEVLHGGNKILTEKGIFTKLTSQKTDKKDQGLFYTEDKTDDKKVRGRWILNEFGSAVLKEKGIKIAAGKILGEAIEPTNRAVKNMSSERAKKFLEKKGVTDEWLSEQKYLKSVSTLTGLDEALIKAKSTHKDIVKIIVKNPKTLKRDNYFQVIGLNNKGKEYVLDLYVTDDTLKNNFQAAIDDYLAN